MNDSQDPTYHIRETAAGYEAVETGTSCNQNSFKTRGASFLFIGPGAKGIGYKAMFKLKESMPQATELADSDSDHFQVGKTGWVTARFSDASPLPEAIWKKWLDESYTVTQQSRKTPKKK